MTETQNNQCDTKKKTPMGLPKILQDPNTTFPRQYRFLFIPDKKPNIQYLVSKISLNYYQKSFELSVLETSPDLSSQDWVLDMAENNYVDNYTLISLNGIGEEIYLLNFQDAHAIWHEVEYDYIKSDVVTHKLGFEFEKMTKVKKENVSSYDAA